MEFRILGPLEVSTGDGAIMLGGPKQRTVLAHLILRADRPVPIDLLIDGLWGEEPPETAKNTLQTYVYRLRQALGEDRISSEAGGYVLHAEAAEIDAARFEVMVKAAKADLPTDPAKAAGARTARALPVGGAFHTPLMQPAADALAADLADVSLAAPAAAVVSNHDGEPYLDSEGWRARSAAHVATPVRWRLVQPALVELGATRVLEVGAGSMLAALAKRTIAGTPVTGIATPDDAEALA